MPAIKERAYKYIKPFYDVVTTIRKREVNSLNLLYFITILEFMQLASTNYISKFPDENMSIDKFLATLIHWSNYLNLLDYFVTEKSSQLYLAIGIQIPVMLTLVIAVILDRNSQHKGTIWKSLVNFQGFCLQLYLPVFFLPHLSICFHFLTHSSNQVVPAILSGVFLIFVLCYAVISELRLQLNANFHVNKFNHKKATIGCYFFILLKIGIVAASEALADISVALTAKTSVFPIIIYVLNMVFPLLVTIVYFRELNIRTPQYSSAFLFGIVIWISFSTFLFFRMYCEIYDIFYVVPFLLVAGYYGLSGLYQRYTYSLIFETSFLDLSINHFDFVVRETFHVFLKAQNDHAASKFYIVMFIENFIMRFRKSSAVEAEISAEVLLEADRYEKESEEETLELKTKKNFFKSNLKTLYLAVLDLMYLKRLSLQHKELSYDLVVGYVGLTVSHQKHGMRGYRIILTYYEKVTSQSSLNTLKRYIIESVEAEMKESVQYRLNSPFVQSVDFKQAINFERDLLESKTLLLEILQKYNEMLALLLEKNIDLDKLFNQGQVLIKQKKKLEFSFRRLLKMNHYSRECFSLYRKYLSMDVAVDRVENLRTLEVKMMEHNMKNVKVLEEELAKNVNVLANGTGVVYVSVFENRVGKILKYTSGIQTIFSYSEEELKYISNINSLQPYCIAEVHNGILLNRIQMKTKLLEKTFQPGVNKAQFIVPVVLHFKFDQLGHEPCIAGLIYKKHINFDWLILNQFGFLMNYTEPFHSKIGLGEYKDNKPLYGYNIATFIPKFADLVFEQYRSIFHHDEENEDQPPKTFFEHYDTRSDNEGEEAAANETDSIHPGQLTTALMFMPYLPERVKEMEVVSINAAKLYNPFHTTPSSRQNGLGPLEAYVDSAEALIQNSNSNNMRLYQVTFIVNINSKEYKNGTFLGYYDIEVYGVKQVNSTSLLTKELSKYQSMLDSARVAIKRTKFGSGALKRFTDQSTLFFGLNRRMGKTSTMRTIQSKQFLTEGGKSIGENSNRSGQGGLTLFQGILEKRLLSLHHNITPSTPQGNSEQSPEPEVPIVQIVNTNPTKKVQIDTENNESFLVEKISPEDDVSSGSDNVLSARFHSLGKGTTMTASMGVSKYSLAAHSGETGWMAEPGSRKGIRRSDSEGGRLDSPSRVSDETLRTERSQGSKFDWGGVLRNTAAKAQEGDVKKVKIANEDYSSPISRKRGGNQFQRQDSNTGNINDKFKWNDEGRKSLHSGRRYLQVEDSPPNLQKNNAIQIPNSSTQLDVPEFQKGLESPSRRPDSGSLKKGERNSSSNVVADKKSNDNSSLEDVLKGDSEEEEAQKFHRKVNAKESQRTSYMSKGSQQAAFYHTLIFDNSMPSYLKKFNLFGLSAFCVIAIMMTILFALLVQLFTQYKEYIKVADYTCQMTSAYSYYMREAEKWININRGYLDVDINEATNFTQSFLEFQYYLYKDKYMTTAMITNLEAVSTVRYGDWSFTLYEPLPDGTFDSLEIPYTGACVRFLAWLEKFKFIDFTTITNITDFVIYYRENYHNYFYALTEVTAILFQNIYGGNRTVDVQEFSRVSLGVSVSIMALFFLAVYPLYRKNESIQIRLLSTFGTFTTSDIERRIVRFKALHSMIQEDKDVNNSHSVGSARSHKISKSGGSQVKKSGNLHSATRAMSGWRKRRANAFVFVMALLVLYGCLSIYFIFDSQRIVTQNIAYLPLAQGLDISTDSYSFVPVMMGCTYRKLNLYEHADNKTYIDEVNSDLAHPIMRVYNRTKDMSWLFQNLDAYVDSIIGTPEYEAVLYQMRDGNVCENSALYKNDVSPSEIEECKLLANSIGSRGLGVIFTSIYEKMDTYITMIEQADYHVNATLEILASKEFKDYDRLAKYVDRAFLYWVVGEYDNLVAALNLQLSGAIESYILGIAMLLFVYFAIWRTFVMRMKQQFILTKMLYSLIPIDLLLSNNYVKKILKDRARITV